MKKSVSCLIIMLMLCCCMPSAALAYDGEHQQGSQSFEGHTFRHIDVRMEGASLDIDYVVKDAGGNVISRRTETVNASVTGVKSVTIDGTTYTDLRNPEITSFERQRGSVSED